MGSRMTTRARVLVVDGDQTTRSRMAQLLGGAGIEVAVAGDGIAALRLVARAPIDLAVVASALPGPLDGPETVRRARLRYSPHLAALFLCALNDWRIPAGGERDDFLFCPFLDRELLGRVFERLLCDGDRSRELRAAGRAAERGLAEAEIACLHRRRAAAVGGDDRTLAAALLRRIEEQTARSGAPDTRVSETAISAAVASGAPPRSAATEALVAL